MTKNYKGYIVIGDIHGCAKSLDALLNRLVAEYGDDRIYFLRGLC